MSRLNLSALKGVVMVSKLRVILGIVGYFMIAGAIGDMDVTGTMNFEQIIFVLVGFVYVAQAINLVYKVF